MSDALLSKPKENFLVRFGKGFISFIVGLSAFSVIKLIFMIPINFMATPDNAQAMQGLGSILVILSIYLAVKYTKNLNANGTTKSRNIKRVITVVIGFVCLMISTVFLTMYR
ncbi:hypothetical protein [Aeromonas salmonicida]|jgi:ABC-type uncharacterized transport system permease subunit|uniref:hypothetical protein n=1 Tax=Aeromonas salmonicida TaxID=645 RepID=UPI0038CF870B